MEQHSQLITEDTKESSKGIVHIGTMRKKFAYYKEKCPLLKYMNFIVPKNPGDINFDESVLMRWKIFGDRSSLLDIYWQCLNLVKCNNEDFFHLYSNCKLGRQEIYIKWINTGFI